MNYTIHNIFTFKVIGKRGFFGALKNIDVEYKNFRTNNGRKPDLTIYLGNFTPENHDCYIVDNKYYIKENYFYCEDSYKVARWKFEMTGFESSETNSLRVRLHTNIPGGIIIPGFIIDHLIGYIMNKKSFPIIHGSCISQNNRAYVFAAQGGSGKTTIALNFVRRGYKLLGDNFTILHDGYALCFLSPLNLFYFNLLPMVKENMNTISKIEYYLKYLLYKTIGIKIATKVNVKDLFPNSIQTKSKLDTIFFLIPRKNFEIEEISKKELIKHLIANQKVDSIPFLKYMLEYSYVFPNSNISKHWIQYEENLKRAIDNKTLIFRVEVPRNAAETFNKILSRVERK